MNSTLEKECQHCHLKKHLSDFPQRNREKGRKGPDCKDCETKLRESGLKRCGRCYIVFPFSGFYALGKGGASRDGYRSECKNCVNESATKWGASHKEVRRRSCQKWRDNRSDEVREKWRIRLRDYQRAHRNEQNTRTRKRLRIPLRHFESRIRNLVSQAFRRKDKSKPGKVFDLLGFTAEQLYDHLSPFLGRPCVLCKSVIVEQWHSHIDHITPLFYANSTKEIIRFNALLNLRLICSTCNLRRPKPRLLTRPIVEQQPSLELTV